MMRRDVLFLILLLPFLKLAGLPVLSATAAAATRPKPGLSDTFLPCPECYENGDKFYISNSEKNGNGTLSSPFNNFDDALERAQPGDTVYVMPGTYDIRSRIRTYRDGTSDRPICIRAYDMNNRPVLKRSGDINGDGQYQYPEGGEYGGEIILIRNPYHVVDGLILDGNFALDNFDDRVQYHYPGPPDDIGGSPYVQALVIAHYGRYDATPGHNGDYAVIRNCVIRNNRHDGIAVRADHVRVENCEIHHNLAGTFDDQTDAHGIIAGHLEDLIIKYCDIHHNSGDSFQIDNDLKNLAGTKQWNNVTIEHCRLWTGELAEDAAGFTAGQSPGENAVDTKTFETASDQRSHITVRNVEVFGFTDNDYIPRRAAFNIKYRTNWFIDGVIAHDNEFVFRCRGPWNPDNPLVGGAEALIQNVAAYNNDNIFRIERLIENLHILHGTFAGNVNFARHADRPSGVSLGYDPDTFRLQNSLFLGTKPAPEADDASNLPAAADVFQDAADHDYRLVPQAPPVNAGAALSEVATDIRGIARPQESGWDVGAYEYAQDVPVSPTSPGGVQILKIAP